MINKERKFLYQPQLLSSCIYWSWTLVVMLIGIIIWLEITTFQEITLSFFIAFIIIAWIQIYFRKIKINNNEVRIYQLIYPKGKAYSLNDVKLIDCGRNSISFSINEKNFNIILPSNSVIELSEIFNAKSKTEDNNES
ncbi:EbsA family protein [Fructilactobacillus vespulae]|uniref:EbsA family protein n=1 Tax=Fructilactobacillus vespulae TaxID=1249630 RepID=UPI0039B54689